MASQILYTHIDEEKENKLILREYRGLLRSLKSRMDKEDKVLMRKAFKMAVDAHKTMRRKSGEPYILHPIAVAKITVDEIGLGVTSAICALLHDTVEDTDITLEDIERDFGKKVSNIIDGLTKISNFVETKPNSSIQAENFRKILLALADDPRVILIKIADRLHNMRTLSSMARDKQLKIASETTFIYAPMAHRLGLYEIKSELEDLALKFTQPDVYLDIVRKLNATKNSRKRVVNEFITPVKDELDKHHINYKSILGRPKSINSIWNKMRKKHVAFEEVYDLFAIRIILDVPPFEREKEKEECWKVYSIVTNIYQPTPERLKDWISVPKSNGYESLHTTVMGPNGRFVEVQIRTSRMNEIAEKGLAAHWKYKEGTSSDSKLDSWLRHIGDVIKNSDSDSLDFVTDFKSDLWQDEIYVYTPKGDMRVMPKNATALDLAFDIHSELGARCIGAKVNYRLMPISTVLKSGDQVEVITSNKQKPNESWLKFVTTAKAKGRIKYYLKEEKRKVGETGKETLYRKLEHMGADTLNGNIQELCNFYKQPSSLDLFYAIATEEIDLKALKTFTLHGSKLIPPPVVKPREVDNGDLLNNKTIVPQHVGDLPKNANGKTAELEIFGESSDKVMYKLAQCCQPIPGDDVFGFVSSGEGLKIHRTDCPNATQLMANYGHRIVKIKWAKNKDISFLTGVHIVGLDDVGIIQSITNIITTEMRINMRSISVDSKDGVFNGNIMVYVHDKEELDELCTRLEGIKDVTNVERFEAEEN